MANALIDTTVSNQTLLNNIMNRLIAMQNQLNRLEYLLKPNDNTTNDNDNESLTDDYANHYLDDSWNYDDYEIEKI